MFNDYYLISVEKRYLPEMNRYYLQCTYSNGLQEITLEVLHGNEIKTILPYERLD